MYSTFDAFLIIAIAGVAVSVILFIIKKLKKRGLLIEEEAETEKSFASQDDYLQQMTTQHGEPDDVITISSVLTPTKSMPILVYSGLPDRRRPAGEQR
jgi:hypothetical protein